MAFDLSNLKYLSPVALAGEQISKSPTAKGILLGKPARTEQLSRYTPEIQNELNQNILQLLQGQGPNAFQQQTNKQLQNQVIPNIAQRFLGSGNRNSSDFQASLGSAAAETLQGNRMQELMSLLGAGTQDTNYFPSEPGLVQQLIPAAAELGKAYLNPIGTGADWLSTLMGSLTGNASRPAQQPQQIASATQGSPLQQSAAPQGLSQDAALQQILDQIINKNLTGRQGQEFNLPQETNPNAFRLGGTSIAPDQQSQSALAFLKNLVSKNRLPFPNFQ